MNEVQYDDTVQAIKNTCYAAVLNAAMQVWDSSVLGFVNVTDVLVSQNCCFPLTRLGSSHWLTASLATVGSAKWNGILAADPSLLRSYFVPIFDTTSGNTAGQVGTAAFTALTEVGAASFGSHLENAPTGLTTAEQTQLASLSALFCGTEGQVVLDFEAKKRTCYQADGVTPLFAQPFTVTPTTQEFGPAE